MHLFATPKSHFSRKVRLLLDHLGLAYELVDVGNVAEAEAALFGDNPMMSVPVLRDQEVWLIDSDHIAAYIVRQYDEDDRYNVLTRDVMLLNARAVMNGIMANEVKLVLSARTGLDPLQHEYFHKAKAALHQGLAWLEARADIFSPEAMGYAEFHFISAWDHLKLYGLMDQTFPAPSYPAPSYPAPSYPALNALAEQIGAGAQVKLSAPLC